MKPSGDIIPVTISHLVSGTIWREVIACVKFACQYTFKRKKFLKTFTSISLNMADLDSCSESSESSTNSDYESFEFDVEVDDDSVKDSLTTQRKDSDVYAYSDEPIADTEWVANYLKRKEVEKNLEEDLKDRLSGKTSISEW